MTVLRTHRPGRLVPAAATGVAAVAALVLAAVGSGAFGGTPVAAAAGGYLSSTATLVAPGVPAFSVWSVIYAGLLAYAVWQFLPSARESRRQERIRPWAASSMLLNAAWLWAVQLGWLPGSLAIMLALFAVLWRLFALSRSRRPGSRAEAILSDGTFGLYLGWICVATLANAAAVLAWARVDLPAGPTAGVAISLAVVMGLLLASTGSWAPLLSLAWGLGWIAAARAEGPLLAPGIAVAAGVGAAAVLAAGGVLTVRRRRVESRT